MDSKDIKIGMTILRKEAEYAVETIREGKITKWAKIASEKETRWERISDLEEK